MYSRLYREGRFQRVPTLLSHGEWSTAGQTAQLPPYTLPLQRVVGHPERKLREHKMMENFSSGESHQLQVTCQSCLFQQLWE